MPSEGTGGKCWLAAQSCRNLGIVWAERRGGTDGQVDGFQNVPCADLVFTFPCSHFSVGLSQFLLRILLLLFCSFLLCGPTSSFTKQSRVLFPLALLSSIGFLLSIALVCLSAGLSFTSDSGVLLMSLSDCSAVCIPDSGDCPFSDSLAAAEPLSRAVFASVFPAAHSSIVAVRMLGLRPQASCSGSQTDPLPQPSATY